MICERICYMCLKCNQGHFINKAEEYSTICPECNIEMGDMGSEFVDSEAEKRQTERFQRALQNPLPLVSYPYCHSTDTKKISGFSKAVEVGLLGILAMDRVGKQWHCNHCGSDF